jgi:hypothetical protein
MEIALLVLGAVVSVVSLLGWLTGKPSLPSWWRLLRNPPRNQFGDIQIKVENARSAFKEFSKVVADDLQALRAREDERTRQLTNPITALQSRAVDGGRSAEAAIDRARQDRLAVEEDVRTRLDVIRTELRDICTYLAELAGHELSSSS